MAKEGTLSINLRFAKGAVSFNFRPAVISPQFDVAGNNPLQTIYSIGLTDTVLDLLNVGTPGYVVLHNLDAVSTQFVGNDGVNYPTRLKPGDFAAYRFNGANIHAITVGSTSSSLEALILPD